MIAPIIFCTVVVGIAGMEDMKKVARPGSCSALFRDSQHDRADRGVDHGKLGETRSGMNIDPATLDANAIAQYTAPGKTQTTTEFIMHIIPTTTSMRSPRGDIAGATDLSAVPGLPCTLGGTLVFDLIEKTSHVLFGSGKDHENRAVWRFRRNGIHHWEYGVFPVAARSLWPRSMPLALLFIFVVLGTIARVHGFSI